MFHVALYEPEIPPNAGNVARLCAATGSRLHLIGRLGFSLDDKRVKRAGLDYWPHVDLVRHATLSEFLERAPTDQSVRGLARVWCIECPAEVPYTRADFRDGDVLLFGSESKGLPADVRARFPTVGIPMLTPHVRSLNLATAVGIVLYDALRRVHGW